MTISGGSNHQPGQQQGQRVYMYLMHCLSFVATHFNCNIVASQIKGINNDLADAISRNNLGYFFSHYPQASPNPTALPQELQDLLIIAKPDCETGAPVIGPICGLLSSQKPSSLHTAHIHFCQEMISEFCQQAGLAPTPASEDQLCLCGRSRLAHKTT